MGDEKVVQEEQVLEKEPVSPEGEKPIEGEKPKEGEEPKPELTEERVQQLIAEATATAVAQAKEVGRRELQGEQDRNRATERRARLAESRASAYEASLSGLDEETRKDIELAKYREQDKYYQSEGEKEAQRQKEATYFQQMNDSLLEEVKSWGIEPEDKRIDYASDAPDYFTGRKRFTDSLQKIVGEKQTRADEEQAQKFKDLEKGLRKDLGLDSVDTTTGSGGGSDSDAEFKKGLGDGSIPLNKVNMERAKKLGLAK